MKRNHERAKQSDFGKKLAELMCPIDMRAYRQAPKAGRHKVTS